MKQWEIWDQIGMVRQPSAAVSTSVGTHFPCPGAVFPPAETMLLCPARARHQAPMQTSLPAFPPPSWVSVSLNGGQKHPETLEALSPTLAVWEESGLCGPKHPWILPLRTCPRGGRPPNPNVCLRSGVWAASPQAKQPLCRAGVSWRKVEMAHWAGSAGFWAEHGARHQIPTLPHGRPAKWTGLCRGENRPSDSSPGQGELGHFFHLCMPWPVLGLFVAVRSSTVRSGCPMDVHPAPQFRPPVGRVRDRPPAQDPSSCCSPCAVPGRVSHLR